MHHNNMVMITCVMKVKENTRIIFLYEKKLQLNAYKRLFDNEYLISIHDIMRYLFLIPKNLLRK